MENTQGNERILIDAGLSEEQALIYQTLIDKGPMKASALSTWLSIKRGLTYKVLEQLEAMGLVSKKGGSGTIAVFSPEHPSRLLDLVQQKERSLALTKETLQYSLGALASKFNLQTGKPFVQFYEGMEAIRRVTLDLPTQDTEILSYIDSSKILSLLPEENKKHIALRKERGISKRMLIPESPATIERANGYDSAVTQARIIQNTTSFPCACEIYDNTTSFLTLDGSKTIGVIIEDQHIANFMKLLFEAQWVQSKSISHPATNE